MPGKLSRRALIVRAFEFGLAAFSLSFCGMIETGCQSQPKTPKPLQPPGTQPKDQIAEKVKKIIVEQLGVDEKEVTPNASMTDDLGGDSLDTVELVMTLEEAFDIEIADSDCEKVKTVQQLTDYVKVRMKDRKSTVP
jgi:acyl carrier protein